MRFTLLKSVALFSLSLSAICGFAQTANELYSRSWQVPTESISSFLTHVEDQISLVSIYQGTSISFDGDQGEGYWQRRKDSDRVFILIRFKDGSRGTLWIEQTPHEVSDALYARSTPLEIFEDGKNKVLAEIKSIATLKEIIGAREIKVHQITLLSPVTVYSVSH